jgi:hypothetical protein
VSRMLHLSRVQLVGLSLAFVMLAMTSSVSVFARERRATAGPTLEDRKKDPLFEYHMLCTGGGRGGLPQVSLYVRKSQTKMFWRGPGGWLEDVGLEPKSMNYPGWNYWHTGVWDALMQLVYEQATDPNGASVKLGRFHYSKLRGTSLNCWTDKPFPPSGLVLDLSNEVPPSQHSFRSDHYVIYGRGNHLYFNGTARMRITIDKARHVTAELMQSTMPTDATDNLKHSIEGLSGHPVISFPVQGTQLDKLEMIVDFAIQRKPGELLFAKTP